jgi:hypothetical protein
MGRTACRASVPIQEKRKEKKRKEERKKRKEKKRKENFIQIR